MNCLVHKSQLSKGSGADLKLFDKTPKRGHAYQSNKYINFETFFFFRKKKYSSRELVKPIFKNTFSN